MEKESWQKTVDPGKITDNDMKGSRGTQWKKYLYNYSKCVYIWGNPIFFIYNI